MRGRLLLGLSVGWLMLASSGFARPGDDLDRRIERAAAATAPSSGAARPNIVLITSDDQTVAEMRWMPQTRKLLARRGLTFTNMFAPTPNCCPARAQILTGQYAHNNGVRTNSPPHGGHAGFTPETALPVWLSEAGYLTGMTGKYMHGYDGTDPVEPGWDHFKPIVGPPLSDYHGLVQYADGQVVRYPHRTYHTRLVARQSAAMINEFARRGDPFFLWSSYIAPHGTCATTEKTDCSGPPLAERKYAHALGKVRLPALSSPSFNEDDLSDKPRRVAKNAKVSPAEQQRLFTARLRALQSLDDAVARTVGALADAGVLRHTVILFTSDNGYLFGEHRLEGKVLPYEESIRVPLLVRGPGLPQGEERDQSVAMIDLAPTFAELADAQPLVPVDGQSLWAWAAQDVTQGGRALLLEAGNSNPDPDQGWKYRGVRTDRYSFFRWRQPVFFELYDRRSDPYQLENVATDRAYRDVVEHVGRLLASLQDCVGTQCAVEDR